MEEWVNKLNKFYKMIKKVHFIHIIQFILVVLGVLAIFYIIALHTDDNNSRKINKEGFISSPRFPDAHHSLLLDSIFERDKSGVFKTFKNQIVNLPVSCVGSYNQKTNNPRDLSPCDGKNPNPNMCLYSKIKKVDKKKEPFCRPGSSPNRVGWFMTN